MHFFGLFFGLGAARDVSPYWCEAARAPSHHEVHMLATPSQIRQS